MKDGNNILLVGIGSPHSDDRVGWMVADAVRAKSECGVSVRIASVPLDLLDWLDGVDQLHVVDACVGGREIGEVSRWTWPELMAVNSNETLFRSTHGFGLVSALRLANRLNRRPAKVVVWGIEVGNPAMTDRTSDDGLKHLPAIADIILQELTDARTISGAVAAESG